MELELELEQLVCCPLHMYFLLLFKLFINNNIRAFGLSQNVAVSLIEVSSVDVDFTEAGLMLILFQRLDLLVLTTVDHIDIGLT